MSKQIIYTDRTDQVLNTYLKEIGKYKILPISEINNLIEEAQSGNIDARNKIITSNLRFVVTIAKQFQGKGIPLMDLISEGNNGLTYAIDKFDISKGVPFLSYAFHWIRQFIYQDIYWNSQSIRIPISQRIGIIKVLKANQEFHQQFGRDATPEELEELTGVAAEDIDFLSQYSNKMMSVDDYIGGDSENNQICDIIPDENETVDEYVDKEFRYEELLKILNSLNVREKDIIIMTFGIGRDPVENKQIARMYGVGTERIRQIKESAIKQLKTRFGSKLRELL